MTLLSRDAHLSSAHSQVIDALPRLLIAHINDVFGRVEFEILDLTAEFGIVAADGRIVLTDLINHYSWHIRPIYKRGYGGHTPRAVLERTLPLIQLLTEDTRALIFPDPPINNPRDWLSYVEKREKQHKLAELKRKAEERQRDEQQRRAM